VYVDDLAKSCDCTRGVYLVLYADDILLLSATVTELQNMLHNCERELVALDLVINVKKSCCMRIGQRSNVMCQRLRSLYGAFLPWLTEIKYLGAHIVESKNLKISTDQSRRSFNRAANAIFARVGRIASEEVVLHLMSTKCILILPYGLEAFPLMKTDLNSLDFVVNRFFMKLFKIGNIDLVKCCQSYLLVSNYLVYFMTGVLKIRYKIQESFKCILSDD